MKRKFKRRGFTQGSFDLQITSLADILIIVLVFLLKSYSTDAAQDVTLPKGISIPEVSSASQTDEGLRIEVSSSSVIVDGQIISPLNKAVFHPNDLRNNSQYDAPTSKSLNIALQRGKAGIWERFGKDSEGKKAEPKVWIIADKQVPFKTIQTVLSSAAVNGYSDFNLAVIKEE